MGNAGTANAQTIRIQSARPVGNLLISSATAAASKPTGQIVGSSLNVVANITVQAGAALNANGLNITLGGDWTNNGTFSNGNTVTFNGATAQALTKSGGETFNNLIINKLTGTLTLNNGVIVNSGFNLAQGTLAIGANSLTLNNTVNGGGILTSAASGTVNYNQGTDGQNVLIANYGNLHFSNFNKALSATGTIGIAGTFTPGTATDHIIAGSSIDFNGGSQPIPAFTYHNLTASGSGVKTGSGIINVEGSMLNNPGIIFTETSTLNLLSTTHTNNGTLSAFNISLGQNATLVNSDSLNAITSLSGAGTLIQSVGAVAMIGGTAGLSAMNATAVDNMVNYYGGGQTVIPVVYHHLIFSGSGTKIMTGVNTVNGNFTLSGTSYAAASEPLHVAGTFRVNPNTRFDSSFAVHIGN